MGCGCIGPAKDRYSIENIYNNKYSESKEIVSIYPITDYVKKVFYLINKIRKSPSDFISYIEQAEKFIKEKDGRKIYDHNGIKVSLNEGKSMFKECADYLKTLAPMDELNFCDDIVLECPTDEKKIKDINIFKDKLLEKKEKQGILAYFKDSIRIPEISVLLMLVDDAIKNPKKKREALLNRNFKYIGISSSDINNNQEDKDKKAENGEKAEEKKVNNDEGEKNANNNNINNINKDVNNNNNNDINKLIRNEVKSKPFCAYFTLK